MATIDSLDIQISSSARKANDAIDSLIANLGKLANSLNIDTSGLKNIGKSIGLSGITSDTKAMSAQAKQITKSFEDISAKYKNLGKDFEPSNTLKKAQSQLSRYSDLLQKAKLDKESLEASRDVNTKGYDTAVKNFYRYGNVIENIKKKIEELNHTPVKLNLDFSQMSEEELDKELGFPNVSTWADKISQSTKKIVEDSRESAREFTGVWNGIELLNFDSDIKNLGDKLSQLEVPPIREENLHKLRASLEKTESKLDELRENLENGITMGRITESIDDSGYVKLQEQIAATEKTAAALRDRINEVGKASQGAAGIKEVGKASDKASDSFSKLSKNTLKASNSLKKMQSGLKGILRAFLPILGIRELVRFGKESIKSSMDYLEVLNYFDAAFGQVASNADLSAFEEMGYDSADAYYNSFAQRAQELTAKMSGFTVGEGGLLESTGAVSLGLDPSQLMNYQAMFGQMSSSMGVSSENALKLSQALTEIGADLASIKNMEFEDVWNDMSSGLAGMSRKLDKYDVNIRNVNLQQKLNELGISANISALNQNDKALLRAIILLENTKYAWGDLAKTINQPANQLRLIEANFQNLARTVGNLFLPIVKTVLPYINALVIAVQRLFAWLGNLIGIDISDISTSIGGADIGGILDQTDDLSDSLGGVAANAKKAKAGLRAFDELKTISMPEESKGGGGAGGIGGGLLDAAFNDAFSKYQQEWDKAFAGLENRAQEVADKIEKAFEPLKKIIQDFAIGDFFQAGKDTSALVAGIFNFFADAIDKVDWYGIGQKIGDFFAGIDWLSVLKSVGNLIWQALKAAFELYVGVFSSAPLETALVSMIAMPKLLRAITSTKIIKGIQNIGVYFADIAKTFKGGGLNGALEKFRGSMSKIQKFSIGAVGVIGEFALVKSGFEELTAGSENLVISLGKIAGGVGLAVGALKLIGLSNPFTAVIVGATALIGAISGITDAQQQMLEKLAEERELSVFGDHLSNITTRLNEAAQATKERMTASIDYVQNAGLGEMQLAKDLADRYFELADKENKTNEETEEMQRLAGLLIEKAPELNKYYDEQTGLINGTRDAINDVIEARLREIQLNAVSEKLTEAYKERVDTLDKLGEAADIASKAQDELARMQSEYNELAKMDKALQAYTAIGELRGKGITQLDDSVNSQTLLNNAIEAGADPTKDLVELQEQLKEILTANGEELPKTLYEATFKFSEQMSGLQSEIDIFSEKYKNAWDTFEEQKEALEATDSTIAQLKTMMSDGMYDVGGDFGKGYEEGILSKVAEVENAAREIADSGVFGLKDEQKSNSPSKVTMSLGEDFANGFNKGIENRIKGTEDTVRQYTRNALEKFSEIIAPLNQIGIDAMQGLLNGLSSMESSTYAKADEIANNVANTVKTALDIHSPSKVMFALGDYTMQGFQKGMENLYQPILASVKDFSYDVAVAPAPSFSDMYGGYVNPTIEYTPQYGGNSGIAGMSETTIYNLFYNAVSAAINNSKLMNDQKDMVEGILKKPTIGGEEIGKMSVRYIQGEERRLQKSLVGTY